MMVNAANPVLMHGSSRRLGTAPPRMSMFVLHPRLAADTVRLSRLQLSLLMMMNDATYPWFILVPEREHARKSSSWRRPTGWR
jgi:hypothetical protein